jgi:2-hydroxychromene-2-carboxylate isomerase
MTATLRPHRETARNAGKAGRIAGRPPAALREALAAPAEAAGVRPPPRWQEDAEKLRAFLAGLDALAALDLNCVAVGRDGPGGATAAGRCPRAASYGEGQQMTRTSIPQVEFWYELSSTYSYLSAMRIEALAAAAGVDILWKPFLLGPIFRGQGWDTSPFNIYPAKGKHMVRDMERLTAARGLPFKLPTPFPQNSLHAARLALIGHAEGWVVAFTRAVYEAEFADGADIGDKRVLAGILKRLGLDADALLERSATPENKDRLRQQTEEAQELGIFGAPSFLTRGELFWGDDRLELALAAAPGG